MDNKYKLIAIDQITYSDNNPNTSVQDIGNQNMPHQHNEQATGHAASCFYTLEYLSYSLMPLLEFQKLLNSPSLNNQLY